MTLLHEIVDKPYCLHLQLLRGVLHHAHKYLLKAQNTTLSAIELLTTMRGVKTKLFGAFAYLLLKIISGITAVPLQSIKIKLEFNRTQRTESVTFEPDSFQSKQN